MRLLISGSWVRAPRWAKCFCFSTTTNYLVQRSSKCNFGICALQKQSSSDGHRWWIPISQRPATTMAIMHSRSICDFVEQRFTRVLDTTQSKDSPREVFHVDTFYSTRSYIAEYFDNNRWRHHILIQDRFH